jgi:glycosyltransferase involved in cell wall biosynthesis
MDDYERMYFRYFDAIGVHMHHRIGFEQMSDLLSTCGVWLYPTRFPEISCMAAMEAQQHGVIPVTTRYAALAETVLPLVDKFKIEIGEDLGPDQLAQQTGVPALLAAAQVPADSDLRHELSAAAEKAYNVADLAKDWLSRLGLE